MVREDTAVAEKPQVPVAKQEPVMDLMTSVPRPAKVSPETIAEKRYRIGTKPDCPRQNYAVAGICFPLYTERVEQVGGETVRSHEDGQMVFLTDEQVSNIKAAVSKRVVRNAGGRRDILEIGSIGFTPDVSDAPLADYLYMIPMREDPSIMKEAMGLAAAKK
jgi:hypothetical protein